MNIKNYTFSIEAMKQTRLKILKIIESYPIEEINKIPDGFNNNLIWNFVHVVVTHQLLCYSLSGLKPKIETEIINAYRKGSKPGELVDKEALKIYSEMAFDMLDQFQQDIENGLFVEYKPYESSYGLTLNNIEEAIQFNLAHETLHLGIMMSMQKAL